MPKNEIPGETPDQVRILLVEDNRGDARLTRVAFGDLGLPCCLDHVYDGMEALQYLRREGRFAEARAPDIILLDLNLPKKSGFDLLALIKNDPELRFIPVIVLTISRSQADINKAYDLHANCYIVKPINLDDFVNIVAAIKNFWLDVAVLPQRKRRSTLDMEAIEE